MGVATEKEILKKLGFRNRSVMKTHVQRKIKLLDVEANLIHKKFSDWVDSWEKALLKTSAKRFVAKTERPPESLIKGADRIVEKIIESWKDSLDLGKSTGSLLKKPPGPRHDPDSFIKTMPDVVRFRILCNYLRDIDYIDKKLQSTVKKDNDFKLRKREDHVATPFPERQGGHRALQYVLHFTGDGSDLLFEVQVMTLLQHSWDKKDHHLIYEYVRIDKGHQIPQHLKNRMAAMSEMLYVADTVFDDLKGEISSLMEK